MQHRDVKKWVWPYPIECGCGHILPSHPAFPKGKRRCETRCMGNFNVTDYPPGYFPNAYHLRGGIWSDKPRACINTCPPCETEVLRIFLLMKKSHNCLDDPDYRVDKQDRASRDKAQADIMLLEEWKLITPRHEKNVRKLYGDDVLRVMQECADASDRTKAQHIITEQVCIAMSDSPPTRIQHRRLVEDLGPTCQGCSRDYSFDPRVLEVDHIRPKSDGGTDAYDNLTLLCPPCNRKKGNTDTLEDLYPRSSNKAYWEQYLEMVAEYAEQDKADG